MGNHGSPNPSSRGNRWRLRPNRPAVDPNRRLPNQTHQPTKTTPQGWCTLIRPEVVHFEVTGDRPSARRESSRPLA